jgi:hypothetical protein
MERTTPLSYIFLLLFHVGNVCRPGTKVFKGREPKTVRELPKKCVVREVYFLL